MRKVIVGLVLIGVGFVFGQSSENQVMAWPVIYKRAVEMVNSSKRACENYKHITISKGLFQAEIVLEGVGPVSIQGEAIFTVDQENGAAKVVLEGIGEFTAGQETGLATIDLTAEGPKD